MSQMNVREAYPGFCTLCHTEVAEFDGFIDIGNGQKRLKVIGLKPNFRIAHLRLSDGTMMTITTCDKCQDFGPEDCDKIMESEMRGWRREIAEMLQDDPTTQDWLLEASKLKVKDRPDRNWSEADRRKITHPQVRNMGLPERIKKIVEQR